MNSITIPSLLAATILVAGIFAFMPIEEASTVHTTIQANTSQISVVTDQSVVANTASDFRVTCGAGSAGCRILDIYLDNDDSTAEPVDAGIITLVLNGESIQLAADAGNLTQDSQSTVALNGVAGVTMTAEDTILVTVAGTSDDFNITVIAETEGDTDITIAEE